MFKKGVFDWTRSENRTIKKVKKKKKKNNKKDGLHPNVFLYSESTVLGCTGKSRLFIIYFYQLNSYLKTTIFGVQSGHRDHFHVLPALIC